MKAKHYEEMWMNLKNTVINQPDKYLSTKEILELMDREEVDTHRRIQREKKDVVQV